MSKKRIIYLQGKSVEVSEEVYNYLKKSDRQLKYAYQDRKQEKIKISEKEVLIKPSREDSLDRLMELGMDFPDKTIDLYESVTQKIMLEQALSKLDDEERNLIIQLFYFDRTEREVAAEIGVSQVYVHKLKEKILCKLYKLLK